MIMPMGLVYFNCEILIVSKFYKLHKWTFAFSSKVFAMKFYHKLDIVIINLALIIGPGTFLKTTDISRSTIMIHQISETELLPFTK